MSHRNPGLWYAGNLMWTRSGTVVATWRLSGLPYGFRPDKDKELARSLHQALFRGLTGEAQLIGVRSLLDPAAVVGRMIEGIDLEECPAWIDECEASLDSLDEMGLGERQYWLCVPLLDRSVMARLRAAARAGQVAAIDALGLPRPVPDESEIALYAEQSRRIEMLIPSLFRAEQATPAQLVWLNLHGQQRGLGIDTDVPATSADSDKAGCVIPEPIVDEGATADHSRMSWRNLHLSRKRLVKVSQPGAPDDTPPSYQVCLTVADGPDQGWTFPGAEILGRIDESGLDVDWTLRLQQRSSLEASRSNRRALHSLNEQLDQREGEISPSMGQLSTVSDLLTQYLAVLEGDKNEVEVQATFILNVAGPTADDALDQAKILSEFFKSFDFRLEQPLGHQSTLWWAMVPGTPLLHTVREYAQIATSRDLSTLVPVTSIELGGNKGLRLGRNISAAGLPGAVLIDPEGYTERNQSGSIAFSGDLGGGKSVAMKVVVGAIMDRGGRFIAVDASSTGEWGTFGSTVADTVVVDIENPAYSLDTLLMFGPGTGARVTQTFLSPLLGIPPRSDLGSLLSEVLEPRYLSEHGITRLGQLLTHLEDDCELTDAHQLARRIRVFASKDFGRVVFDETLPPLPMDAAGIVIRTHTLDLPSRDELLTKHLYDELSLEKIFGRAIYALVTNMARWISAADRARLTAFVGDEFHHIATSPEAVDGVEGIVRKGRKEKTVAILGSQNPGADYEDSSIRGLIPTRIAMRTESPELAADALQWLGLDPKNDELIEILTQDTSPIDPATEKVLEGREGEGFMRDASRNVGRVKVDLPAVPQRAESCLTTPAERTAQLEAVGAE